MTDLEKYQAINSANSIQELHDIIISFANKDWEVVWRTRYFNAKQMAEAVRPVKNSEIAADNINIPHEDYPYRVRSTCEIIKWWIKHNINSIDEILLNSISHYLWFEWHYRTHNVQVGNHIPIWRIFVKENMKSCYWNEW